jgi:hypothetical protein
VSTQLEYDRRTWTETDGFDRECQIGTSNSRHDNNKCVISEDDWLNSPEVLALPQVNNPWNAELDGPRTLQFWVLRNLDE